MPFVSFWRCLLCSAEFSSCLPLKIKQHSPSFAFTPFSLFSSSLSSDFTRPLSIILDLLTKELGFSSSQVKAAMRRSPSLLKTKSDHTAREVIYLLKDYGFNESKLKNAVLGCPTILQLKVDGQLKPKMDLLEKLGLTSQDIIHMVASRPRFFTLSLEKFLAPRILQLETLFGSKVHLCKALRIAPQLLTIDFEKQVKPKVEYLKNNIGILECSGSFARALDAVVCLSFETLDAKIKLMMSLGLGAEEISHILKVFPRAFRISNKKLKENIDFLMHTARFDPTIIASYFRIVFMSLEKRLVPRYKVFQSLRTNPHVKVLPSLVGFFRLAEKNFLKYADQCSVKSIQQVI